MAVEQPAFVERVYDNIILVDNSFELLDHRCNHRLNIALFVLKRHNFPVLSARSWVYTAPTIK
jgi:hypothetical protein